MRHLVRKPSLPIAWQSLQKTNKRVCTAAGEEGEDIRSRGHLAKEMGFFDKVKKR